MALAAEQDNGFGIQFPVPTLTEGTACYPPKIFWITEAENWKGTDRIRGEGGVEETKALKVKGPTVPSPAPGAVLGRTQEEEKPKEAELAFGVGAAGTHLPVTVTWGASFLPGNKSRWRFLLLWSLVLIFYC